jgi:hypothetical protein
MKNSFEKPHFWKNRPEVGHLSIEWLAVRAKFFAVGISMSALRKLREERDTHAGDGVRRGG